MLPFESVARERIRYDCGVVMVASCSNRRHVNRACSPVSRAGCQVAVEFLDPDGHHLELYWDVDQIGSDGRARPENEWRPTASLEEAVRKAPPGQNTTLYDADLRARVEAGGGRSEERRVGKECRSRWSPYH